ncbi:MAG: right-handed parallel beta-helix repeat-containing protein [bacterium]|nr:right-handed parallel beta-helix repeat-containing protein [bacterium]
MLLPKLNLHLYAILCLLLFGLILSPPPLLSAPDDGGQENQPASTIIYVNDDAGGNNDGSSWANAFQSLQEALEAADSGDQIWVAAGTYRPSAHPAGCTGCATNRDYTFLLPDGVAVYGGFAGTENPATFNLTSRDFSTHETILSGDIGTPNDDSDNVHHVVLAVNATTRLDGFTVTGGNADGLILISLHGQNISGINGGGIATIGGNNTLINNTVTANSAFSSGGGVFANSGNNTLTNNIMADNSAFIGGGIYTTFGINNLSSNTVSGNTTLRAGGGIYIFSGTNELANNTVTGNTAPEFGGGIYTAQGDNTMNNNTVTGNSTSERGGGIYVNSGTNTLVNNTITGNSTSSNGGGIYTEEGTNTLTNNTVTGNTADEFGGGMYIGGGTNTLTNNVILENSADNGGGIATPFGTHELTNNVISGNSASFGGGVYTFLSNNTLTGNLVSGNTATTDGGGISFSQGTNTLTNNTVTGNEASRVGGGIAFIQGTNTLGNNIIWGNNSGIFQGLSNLTVNNNIIQGSFSGSNNLDDDPLFVDAANGDFHLQQCSPAIDVGNNAAVPDGVTTDIAGSPRQVNATGTNAVDLGAYEYQQMYDVCTECLTSGNIIYVDFDATAGSDNGTSWANAFQNLQDALEVAATCPNVDQIWVAAGTYRPSAHPAGCTSCATNRDYTFLLPDGVAVYGGFAGTENPATFNLASRDFNTHETILSGDIGTPNDDSDNVHHVVLALNATTRLDGFTVTGGNADGVGTITVNGQSARRSRGGGIYTSGGSNTLTNNRVANNFADSRGGGISTSAGTNTLTNNTVTSNEVGSNGGGISNDGGYNTLNNNTVTGNSAFDGGGIYTDEGHNTLSNNTVMDNSASYGGGIHIEEGTDTLNNNTVTGNEASREGGGIFTEEGSNILSNNTVTGNSASIDGGGVYTRDGSNSLINNTVSGNEASEEGGGVYTFYGSNSLTDNMVTGNSASREGGGIYTDYSDNTLTNNTVTENSAIRGGGIFTNRGTNTLINNTVSENTASGRGGGIYTDFSDNTLTNNTVAENEANEDGGGIYIDRGTNTLTNNTVAGNKANDDGGGVFTHIGNNTLTNNRVTGNEAGRGGGILISDGTIMLTNNTVSGNSADDDGGGIFTIESNNTLVNNTVSGNSADDDGGGIYTEGSSSTLINNTVSGNMASGSGGGIYIDFGMNTLTNNIIWGNNSGLEFEAINLTVNHNIIQGGVSDDYGTNNLDDDPHFVNPLPPGLNTGGDYRLLPCSPAIDAGTGTGAPTEDILGNLRPIDGNGDATATTDMGAYEYQGTVGYGNHIYVDLDATAGNNDGTSWADAFLDLQTAINAAVSCGVESIWVAEGTYYPDEGGGNSNNDRNAAFVMQNNLAIYGGFNGSEAMLSQRDWAAHPTILSGDIDGNSNLAGNSYHVIFNNNNGLDNSAILDGFTVTGGNADGSNLDGSGGGMFNNQSSPTIINCSFQSNSASLDGGGMYNAQSSPTITNCTFQDNSAIFSSGGGGVGGGILNDHSSPTITNCSFQGNSASLGDGGGIYNIISSPSITNCILWGNGSEMVNFESNPTVSSSIVQGGYPAGTNILDLDPLFVDAANGDLRLQECSPAVNAGDGVSGVSANMTTTDLDGNPRFFNSGVIDMGAYEFQGTPTPVVANCQNQTVVLDDMGNGSIEVASLDDGSTGCGSLSFAVDNASMLTFDCTNAGDNPVTLTVTDNRGQSSTCEAIINVQDNTVPTAACQDITVQLDANGNASITANDIDDGSTDACGIQQLSLSPTEFGCAQVGNNNTVTLTVTDNNGNTASCSADVTVEDNIAPTAACLNTTVELQPDGMYHLQQSDVFDAANSSDNCPFGPVPGLIENVSFPATTFGCDDVGLTFPVTVTLTDPSGNSGNCTANITVGPGTALPSGWAATDIGSQGDGSDYAYDPCARKNPNRGDFNVSTGAYNLIPNNSDNLAFVGRELCNNGGIQARIEDVNGGYAGLMIRESSAPGAKMVAVYSNLTSLLRRETRTVDNGPRASGTLFAPFPFWLRLMRQGNYIRAFYRTSDNGSWTLFHQAYLPMQECVEMGLAVFTTAPNGQADATFSRVQWQSNVGGSNNLAIFNEGPAATHAEEREISVFPNPARSAFTLAFSRALDSGGIAILRNQMGQIMAQRPLQAGEIATDWDVSRLPGGLYLMEIRQEGWPPEVLRVIKTD